MKGETMSYKFRNIILLGLSGSIVVACTTMENPSVVAVTGTTIGLEVAQNSGTGTPEAALGYKRGEVAVVSDQTLKDGDGKEDVANVVMELRYSNSGPNAGIYQRLAVGRSAVSEKGAAFMFAKGVDGELSDEASKALNSAFQATSGDGFGDDDDM